MQGEREGDGKKGEGGAECRGKHRQREEKRESKRLEKKEDRKRGDCGLLSSVTCGCQCHREIERL